MEPADGREAGLAVAQEAGLAAAQEAGLAEAREVALAEATMVEARGHTDILTSASPAMTTLK